MAQTPDNRGTAAKQEMTMPGSDANPDLRSLKLDGRIVHAILLEIFTDGGVGTLLSH